MKEKGLRQSCKKIMVIDDLANRHHDCDFLLDQNFYIGLDDRYTNLVPKKSVLMLGPKYALLRPEFLALRREIKLHNGIVNHIFVFMGSGDQTNETGKVLAALKKMEFYGLVDVVVGSANPHKNEIAELCDVTENFAFHQNVDNIAQLMAKADFAIGAAGATTWERSCLGLPSALISLAKNQVQMAQDTDHEGLLCYLGASEEVSEKILQKSINSLLAKPGKLRLMSRLCFDLVDGNGCDLVLKELSVR